MPVRLHTVLALLLTGTVGCGLGSVDGPGGGDGDGDGDGGGGGGGGGGPTADAIPAEGIVCSTVYTVSGDVSHAVPVDGSGCDGTGTWTVTIGDPAPDDEYDACGEAPAGETFNFSVTMANEVYSVSDQGDPGRVWTVQVSDKGGSCAATFKHDLGGGAELSLGPRESAPDGPLSGAARYEIRE